MPRRKSAPKETDGAYILKIVLYLIVGSQWVWLLDPELTWQVPIPIGLITGGLFATHDKFQIDRKVEFALLLGAAFVGFWSHTGFNVIL